MMSMSESKYYDFGPLLSRNALIAMAVGGRGIGKSYGAKELAIVDWRRGGHQFMYVRRYKDEIKKAREHFFDDIAGAHPDLQFRVRGNEAQVARAGEKKASWEVIGYFVALSTVQQLKSVPFPRVKRIIFDEFIPERGAVQYLPSEHDILLNLINTVDRHTDRVMVLMLANAVSIMNPHFLAYGITPADTIRKYADGLVAVDFPSSEAYTKATAHTRTARLFAQHEDYNAYATLNEFADNAPTMLGAKPSSAIYKWSLEVSTGTFSVWRDDSRGHWFVQAKRPKSERVLTIVAGQMDHEKLFVSYADLPLSSMRTAFRHGRMSFDTPTTRNAIVEIFKR